MALQFTGATGSAIRYPADQTLTHWDDQIKAASTSTVKTFWLQARSRYQAHVTPDAVRKAKSYEEWIVNWEIVVATGVREQVAECLDSKSLAQDLGKIIKAWLGAGELAHKINENADHFNAAEVTGKLRSRLMLEGYITKKPAEIDYKAGFGAAQVESNSEASGHNSDRSNDSKSKRGYRNDRRAPKKVDKPNNSPRPTFGRKRNNSVVEDTTQKPRRSKRHKPSTLCEACRGKGHTLDDCYYLHDYLRHDSWKPQRGLEEYIALRLKTDNDFKKKVEQSRKAVKMASS